MQTMTTATLKKKIKALVDKETNAKKLAKAYELLTKETKTEAVRRRMQEVAEASEKDIRAGRTVTIEEFDERSRALIKSLFAKKRVQKTAASRKAKAVKRTMTRDQGVR